MTNKIKTSAGTYVEDIRGQKFGRLTVTRLTDKLSSKHWLWECECDCGNIILALASNLKRGNVKSCGCLKKETSKINGKNRKRDITNQRFGKLIALFPVSERRGTNVVRSST